MKRFYIQYSRNLINSYKIPHNKCYEYVSIKFVTRHKYRKHFCYFPIKSVEKKVSVFITHVCNLFKIIMTFSYLSHLGQNLVVRHACVIISMKKREWNEKINLKNHSRQYLQSK